MGASLRAIEAKQLGTPTRNPAAGAQLLYPKADGLWYTKNSAGVESAVGSASSVTWSTLTGKPTTFPPSTHTHTLIDLPDAWVKRSVRVATTGANITLSGLQTIDGVALVAGDRVLVKDQTTPSQNGIYSAATGAWARTAGANISAEIAGGTVSVDQGFLGGQIWSTTFKTTDTLGTTPMYWFKLLDSSSPGGVAAASIVASYAPGATTPSAATWTGIGDLAVIAQQGTDVTFNAGLGQMTINKAGWYRIYGGIQFATGAARSIMRVVWATTVGGINPDANILVSTEATGSGNLPAMMGTTIAYLPAGAVVVVRIYVSSSVSMSQKTFSIEAVGASSTVDNTGTVAFRGRSGGLSYAAGSACPMTTVREDTHGGWNSSTHGYTVKVPGLYMVSGSMKSAVGGPTNGSTGIAVNGAMVLYAGNGGTTTYGDVPCNGMLRLNVGDVVSLRHNTAITTVDDAPADSVYLHIARIDAANDRSADTGWLSLPFATGWGQYASPFRACQYKRVGKTVTVRGLIQRTGAATSGSSIMAVLPPGFRPFGNVTDIHGCRTGAAGVADVRIDYLGNIQCTTPVTATEWLTLQGVQFDVD